MATRTKLTVTKVAGSSDIVSNTSKIKIVQTVTATGESWNANDTTKGRITIDGVEVASLDKKRFYKNSTTTIYNAEHTVQHEPDGRKTVKVVSVFDTHISAGVLTREVTLELDPIPREAQMTVPSMTLGKEAKIQVDNPSGMPYTIRYTFGAKSGVVIENGSGNVVPWTPPYALAEEIPNEASGKGTLSITTYSGNEEVKTNEYAFSVTVPDNLGPKINAFLHAFRSEISVISGWGVGVKGKTKLGYTVDAAGQYGAKISGCTVAFAGSVCDGLSGETGTLTQAGQFAPKITVTDSRGKTTVLESGKLTVHDYVTPSFISSDAFRSNENGNEQSDGTYVTVTAAASFSPVGGYNSASLKARRRVANGSWGEYSEIAAQGTNVFPNFDKILSYEVEIVAVDAVGESKSVVYVIPTESVAFHLREGGGGAAFGRLATEENLLDVAWDLRVKGRMLRDWVHPVGSICVLADNTDPGELYGGTWERVESNSPYFAWKRTT